MLIESHLIKVRIMKAIITKVIKLEFYKAVFTALTVVNPRLTIMKSLP